MTTSTDLSNEARRLLGASDAAKVEWIRADSWVHTRETTAAFQWMEYLLRSGPVIRPPCLKLIGGSGMGKSATLLAFEKLHPVQQSADEPLRLQRPVLLAECKPDVKGEAGVRHALLKACWPGADDFRCTEREIDETLRAQGVRLILLDELGEITKAGVVANRRALSELKRIGNSFRVGIVAGIVTNLAHVLNVDEQFASRFKREITLQPWSLSEQLRNFVYGLERNLPFPKPSNLYGADALPWIAHHGDGNTKEIIELIRLAALHALGAGSPCITHEHLELAAESEFPPQIVFRPAA